MTLTIKTGGSWRTVTAPSVRVSGAWRPVQNIWVRSGGSWRQAFAAYVAPTVSVDRDYISGYGIPNGSAQTVATEVVAALVANGRAPFTYQWELLDGAGIITSAATASTGVRYNFPRLGGTMTGSIRCKVTDALGTVSYSPVVTYYLQVSEEGTVS
ncbi:hypothetical protein DMC25_27095 [Caulobacter sp. D4A]|nr:hypothetical protein DMC25_27095 [Caulobacter sp. D4A]PXA96809.1 hypothetical protein DMC18_00670 [Caulobacter sp. D5]